MPDITDLLDRTTPTDLAPVDVAAVAQRGRRRRHRRRAAVVAAPVVVLALAVAVNAARTDDGGAVSASDGEGTLPRLPQDPGEDATVFLNRTITQGMFDALERKLNDDPRILDWEYLDAEASVEEYRQIFAGDPEMLAAAEENPELVPTSFRLRLVDDRPDALTALMEEYAVLDGVTRVTSPLGETPEAP